MKKSLIAVAVASFAFAGSASATGEVTCMGCGASPQWNKPGHHHVPAWQKPDMSYDVKSYFKGDVTGGSETYGFGAGEKNSQTYAVGEQDLVSKANIIMTDFLAGTGCSGACDQNKAQIGFAGHQSLKTGGIQESSGTDYSGAFIKSEGEGSFKAGAELNWD